MLASNSLGLTDRVNAISRQKMILISLLQRLLATTFLEVAALTLPSAPASSLLSRFRQRWDGLSTRVPTSRRLSLR